MINKSILVARRNGTNIVVMKSSYVVRRCHNISGVRMISHCKQYSGLVDKKDGIETRNVLAYDCYAGDEDETETENGSLLAASGCGKIRWHQYDKHKEGS